MRAKLSRLTVLGVAGISCPCLSAAAAVFLFGGGDASMAGSNFTPAVNLPLHPDSSVRLAESYGKLPLSFEVNQGQVASQVKFLSRGRGYALFLTGDEAVLTLKKSEARSQKPEEKRPLSVIRSPAGGGQKTTDDGLRTTDSILKVKLVGSNSRARVTGIDPLPGKSNYFIGNDPSKWRTNVPNYAKVEYRDVYRGVDLIYYGNQRQLEYDFVVVPGADPSSIQFAIISGEQVEPESQSAIGSRKSSIALPLQIAANGDLAVQAGDGEVRLHKPIVYQVQSTVNSQGSKVERQSPPTGKTYNELRTTNVLDGHYVLKGNNLVTFEVASYDRSKPLIIDPVLVYSTYLGGSGPDAGIGIAVDASGHAYVTGETSSVDFPTMNASQPASAGGGDAFVSKLNAAGSALVYSTYLGGSGSDVGTGIAVDGLGNAYVTGQTRSINFPTTSGVFQTSLGGLANAFVAKLNSAGSALLYSTYLGGSGSDAGTGIAVDGLGNAYVTGQTRSTNFPTTSGAFQTSFGGGFSNAFVSKLNAGGLALAYSTYLGGSRFDLGSGIAVDASGNAYVTGQAGSTDFPITLGAFQTSLLGSGDAFVSKLNAAGSALVYSTYLGGSGFDGGFGVAVDASGNAYVTGETLSSDFPTTSGALQTSFGGGYSDAFVSKLNAAGSALVYSSYLGGRDGDQGSGIAVDASGDAYVTGLTDSADFPTSDPLQPNYGGGGDAFVTKLNAAGSALVYSTYLGGRGGDPGSGIAVDASGNAYVTGSTGSPDFPTLNPFQAVKAGAVFTFDAFVVKISPANAPGIAFSRTVLAFGDQPAGTTSSPQTITVTNVGSQPLVFRRIVSVSSFPQTHTCGASLAPGQRCTISVTFAPTSRGPKKGLLFLVDNVQPRPIQFVWMSGTGT